ncbi:ABC transporter ATP-binding protein [Clostridium sp. 'White wine YQ']|uniref:ABC transporter ATP-binding protein n=1 Tax=Clostridium sp. 'White wine YQ' TaxID=3027474 RepID=UPI0023664B94|nr:ABC transporter ATP-binding protein [Clostridium sp. 'White wine YQ']MDD7794999.1 ABC transporter ATP-binding protein [Clostridium sp. 'White wine YQ']
MSINSIKQDEMILTLPRTRVLKRLFSYLKPYGLKVFIVILLLIFVMVVGLVNPYFLKISIDKYIGNSDYNGLMILALLFIVLNVASMIASRFRILIMSSVTNNALVSIRNDLYTHIQKLGFAFFDSRPVGKILARVIGDVNALGDLFTNSVTSLIPELLSLICVTFIMFFMNAKLALASIALLPILFILMFSIETISRKKWEIYRSKRSNLNAYTHENFSGVKIVQGFANENLTNKNFSTLLTDMLDRFMDAVRYNDFFWPLVELSWGIGTIIVFLNGIKLIDSNEITIGTLIAFTMYIGMFWRPIVNISNFYNTLITNFAAAQRIFEIMEIKPDIYSIDSAEVFPEIKGTVEFKDVSFSYDSKKKVLNNVSFKVTPGENIALVGPTGAGKTTIVNLISRFYDATSGKVLIDNKNIKHMDLESLRSQMGIMLQDTFLFSSTIKENIRYGKLNATDEEVIAAAKAVNAHDFIMKLEKGYDTEVSERGSKLSVGQRQLLSFARALLANPRILILDEATSNIDTHTEKLVQQGIEKLLTGRTSFVIAHRLSTIRDCDRIMVIDDGQIIENGNHDELIELKGSYYSLYMSQYKLMNEGA